jgi:hypothetical protein
LVVNKRIRREIISLVVNKTLQSLLHRVLVQLFGGEGNAFRNAGGRDFCTPVGARHGFVDIVV